MKDRKRLETLYRVMYESFTPGMMRRTPMWLKRRIAAKLDYVLVKQLNPNDWLTKLFLASPGEPSPIAISMFETCVGGWSVRVFFRPSWWWWTLRRIWKGETRKIEAPHKSLARMLPDEGIQIRPRRYLP